MEKTVGANLGETGLAETRGSKDTLLGEEQAGEKKIPSIRRKALSLNEGGKKIKQIDRSWVDLRKEQADHPRQGVRMSKVGVRRRVSEKAELGRQRGGRGVFGLSESV